MYYNSLITGVVDVFIPSSNHCPDYKVLKDSRSFFIKNCRGVKNQGNLMAVNFFLERYSGGLGQKTQKIYASHILQFIEFWETRSAGVDATVPYEFDLFKFDENDLKDYRDYLREAPTPRTGKPRVAATWQIMIYLVCEMYQCWSEMGWYNKSLGLSINPRQELRKNTSKSNDQLSYTRKRTGPNKVYPMGSIYSKPTRQDIEYSLNSAQVVRCFTAGELQKVQIYLQNRIELSNKSYRDTAKRDDMIFKLVALTGLRAEEIQQGVKVRKINGCASNEPEVGFDMVGKGDKIRQVKFPQQLLGWLQSYINKERRSAVAKGIKSGTIKKEPDGLFVSHEAATLGSEISINALQKRVTRACLRAGLVKMEPHPYTKNHDGSPLLVKKATRSIHDLRHTFAVIKYFEKLKQFSLSDGGHFESSTVRAMMEVQKLLGHSQLETTQNTYAPYVHNYRSLEEFFEATDQQRIHDLAMNKGLDDAK